jgi:COMPASS component SWD3
MIITKDEQYLFTCSLDKVILKWDPIKKTILKEFNGHTEGVVSIALINNEKELISCSMDSTIRIWDIETGKTKKIKERKSKEYYKYEWFKLWNQNIN